MACISLGIRARVAMSTCGLKLSSGFKPPAISAQLWNCAVPDTLICPSMSAVPMTLRLWRRKEDAVSNVTNVWVVAMPASTNVTPIIYTTLSAVWPIVQDK